MELSTIIALAILGLAACIVIPYIITRTITRAWYHSQLEFLRKLGEGKNGEEN